MNLQGKLSGLKGLVSHSHGKRRFKGDLTLDMISPPLGDFRHTMHVGRGGDVFGDTSFLSNHGGKDNGNAGGDADSNSTPDNKIGAFFSRTLRQVRKGSTSEPRPPAGPKELSPPPPPVSPIIKNAISLPRLDVDAAANGSPTAKVLFPTSPGSPEETKYSYGPESGFVTLPRLSRAERQQPSISRSPDVHRGSLTDPADAILSSCPAPATTTSEPDSVAAPVMPTPAPATGRSDSLPSLTSLDFTFDLGPSLMSEVFGLIDSPDGHSGEGGGPGHAWEGEEAGSACGLTNEGSEMDSATISYVDSLQREDCGGGKSPCGGGEWGGEEEEEGRLAEGGVPPLKGTVPDVAMVGSPARERRGMESERFQSATDALARHYGGGGGGSGRGQGGADAGDSEETVAGGEVRKKTSYSYDEEEEIKV